MPRNDCFEGGAGVLSSRVITFNGTRVERILFICIHRRVCSHETHIGMAKADRIACSPSIDISAVNTYIIDFCLTRSLLCAFKIEIHAANFFQLNKIGLLQIRARQRARFKAKNLDKPIISCFDVNALIVEQICFALLTQIKCSSLFESLKSQTDRFTFCEDLNFANQTGDQKHEQILENNIHNCIKL